MQPYRFANRPRERPLLQVADMRKSFPQFRYSRAGGGALVWRGTLQPTESSPVYTVDILHQVWKEPRVVDRGSATSEESSACVPL